MTGTHPTWRVPAASAGAVACAAILAGLAGADRPRDPGTTVTIYAASSLQGVAEELAEEFESSHDDVTVVMSYGGSSTLAAQIIEGAPANLFLSADDVQAERVADQLGGTTSTPFASNSLTIAVPIGNPAGVRKLADLTDDALVVALCSPDVPCGRLSDQLASTAGLRLAPDTEELSVADVLAKVSSGQADAGLVYLTDIARTPGVEQVVVEGTEAVATSYVAVELRPGDGTANAFVDLLASPVGRQVLGDAGFSPP